MSITIQISADTPEDLQRMLREMASAFGGGHALAPRLSAAQVPDDKTAVVTIEPPAPAQPDTPEPSPPTEASPPLPPAGSDEQSGEAPPANVVKAMDPAEMRQKGTDMLMKLFNQDPAKMEVLRRLQAKFGVKMFKDIPDDRAQEFYNDALLAANGTAEKAAA
jgi:hypothetical protein